MEHELANAWWRSLLLSVRHGALLCGLLCACAEAPLANGSVDSEVRDDDDEEDDERDDDDDDDDDKESGKSDRRDAGSDAGPKGSLDAATRPDASKGSATYDSSVHDATASSDWDDAALPHDASLADAALPGLELDASLQSEAGVVLAPEASSPKPDAAARDASLSPGPLCRLGGNQIAVIGDSYLDLSGDITRFIQATARTAGALGPLDSYIDRALSGASMAYEPSIPTQFTEVLAVAEQRRSPGVRLVIMDGGGNDMLLHNRPCLDQRQPDAACLRVVETSVRTLKKLFIDMASAGVKEVIYFSYPDLPGGGLGGSRPHVMNGYATPLMREACEENRELKCTFIDTRPAFAGHADYISPADNVHPTAAGSRVIADLVWNVMLESCVGSR